jgi:hypothetical protein
MLIKFFSQQRRNESVFNTLLLSGYFKLSKENVFSEESSDAGEPLLKSRCQGTALEK